MSSGWRLDSGKTENDSKSNGFSGITKNNSDNTANFSISEPKYRLNELVLPQKIIDEVQTIIKSEKSWKKVFDEWKLSEVIKDKNSLIVNLYGKSGTGKTMTAHAIANELNRKIICVNYSEIESKYVGETSKNLAALFKYAYQKEVIIFFDEADALLSKRVTDMSNATDVSVNQTRSVLLTLMNDYKGMIIFASNFISNYDTAFIRRIQYHIKFELPDEELRKKLWKKYIPENMPNDADINYLSKNYPGLTGSDIANIVLKAALFAAGKEENIVHQEYFENEIKNILNVKKDNNGFKITSVTQREVSEDYALQQISNKQGDKT